MWGRDKAKLAMDLRMAALLRQCQEDIASAEHDYHDGIARKSIELAKLDAEIDYKRKLAGLEKASYERIITEKDKVIDAFVEVLKQRGKT